ncbi:MAG: hypothetical protein JWN37_615 [Candidatus Nomurabacteria bacterium]|nr:hypothetical protein [Candidatus Nomurabacteria bacterium]
MNKTFTVILNFSDHLIGIEQYEKGSPIEALKEFITSAEALNGYDRELLTESIMPLLQGAKYKGVWMFHFKPELDLSGEDDNQVLGGTIVQTDPEALTRT